MKTRSALAASMLKEEIKKMFPKKKVRVVSQRYSMGSSINVRVEPDIIDDVKRIADKYAYDKGSNIDDSRITEYRDDVPQASFVFVQKWD